MRYPVIVLVSFHAATLCWAGCKKPADANDENEHEAINKVELIFQRAGLSDQSFVAEDPDGDGGLPPTRIDTLRLMGGQTYTVRFRALNIVNGVVRDITPTIEAQANAHEIFYVPSGVALQVTKLDQDSRGFPLGIRTQWTVPATGMGSIVVKLMHKTGIKGPSDSPDLGHSDLELPMRIEIN